MRTVPLDLVGGLSFDRYTKMSSENTYNMIIADEALVSYAGYKSIATVLSGQNVEARALYTSIPFNHMIAVYNENVYIISPSLGVSKIATLETNSGPVYISENEANQIAFSDLLNIYILNTMTGVFTKALTSGMPLDFEPGYITYQDGYLISPDRATNQWRLSDPNNGLNWPASAPNIGFLQTRPDKTRATVAFNRQLFVLGGVVTEIWHDVGNTLFPYQRDNSVSINYGILSVDTLAAEFDVIVWLSSNQQAGPTIVYSKGGPVTQLSTDGINFLLDNLDHPEDSSGFLFQENGHIFYQITFPSDNLSIVYDFTTGKFFTLTNTDLNFHIAKKAAFFSNRNFFISFIDGNLYQFGNQITTYDGKTMPKIRITKNYRFQDAKRFMVSRLAINLEQGASNQKQIIQLSMSRDGGYTFGNAFEQTFNTLGNYRNKLTFYNLGSGNDIVFQFRFYSGNETNRPLPSNVNADLMNQTERTILIGAEMDLLP